MSTDWEKQQKEYEFWSIVREYDARQERLKRKFTQEERKMFEEYDRLDRTYSSNCLLTERSPPNQCQIAQETYDKVLAYVEQMLLIPGAIDRCKEYLEIKHRRSGDPKDKKYSGSIDYYVFRIENARELSAFTEKEKTAFDEYEVLEYEYWVSQLIVRENLKAEEAYEKAIAFARERFNGSLDRCWDYLNKKRMTLYLKTKGEKPYTPFIKDFSRKQ